MKTAVVREKQDGHNVVGYLPATARIARAASRGSCSAPTTITSAAAATATRSPPRTDAGKIHHGADDNASGIGGGARRRPGAGQRTQRSRHVVLAFWSAEEIGLIGSTDFVAPPPVPTDGARRLPQLRHGGPDAGQQAHGAGRRARARAGRSLIEQANVAAGFDLVAAGRSVPADRRRQLQPGRRAEPRRSSPAPTSTTTARATRADKINYEDLDRVVDFAVALASPRRRARRKPPAFTKVDQVAAGRRAGRRARLHRHHSRLRHRGRRGCSWAASSAAAPPSRPACRRATSSSSSPGRRSPTSTTTPTRSKR